MSKNNLLKKITLEMNLTWEWVRMIFIINFFHNTKTKQ